MSRYSWFGRQLLVGLCVAIGSQHAAGEEPSREYRIKAAFLYNLTKFITWPDEKTWAANAPIAVCIYGFNPFDTYIRKLEQRSAKGRAIVLHFPNQPDQLRECHVVFVSQYNTQKPDLQKVRAELPALLTVGDAHDFIANQGMVGLVAAGNNVQLEIHLTRAREAGFSVSADLLEIAHKVE
jgi:hypothetical protein